MDYSYLALEMLSEYLGENIILEDTAVESNNFEIDELDESIIPIDYQLYLINHSKVMTHLYAYDSLIAYIIYPYNYLEANQILVGLLKENVLINYHIISRGKQHV